MNLVSDNHSTVFVKVLCKGLSVEYKMVSNSVLSQSTEHWIILVCHQAWQIWI